MYRFKKFFPVITACVFYLLTNINAIGQARIDQDINLANSLKKKYGDKVEVVCLKSVTTVTFNYTDSKKALSPVSAYEYIDESLIALKDGYKFGKALYYGDYSVVDEVKSYGKNNRPTDIFAVDIATGDNDVFYSGEHCKAFEMQFSSLGEKQRYTADKVTGDLKQFRVIPFPDYYPFEEKTVIFNVPKWLNIDFKEMNFDGYDITKTVTTEAKTGNTLYTFTAKNLKNYHSDEENKPNFYATAPHILILPKSYTTSTGTTVNILNSMDDVYGFCEKLVKDAGNNNESVKQLVTQLTQDKKTDVDKIKAIYYWVQDNIRYIAFENGIAGWQPSPCQDVYKNKYGDCKGMANLLTVMLKDAGYDARRTWIGANGIPYDFSTPSLNLFNHAICTLVLNGKHYFLDGTRKYATFGDNSDWIQGRPVLIEDGDKYMEDKIPVEPAQRNKIKITQDLTVSGTDLLSGKENVVYNGESRIDILESYNMAPTSERSADMKEIAQARDKNIEVSQPVTSDLQNREIPVSFAFDFKIKDQVSVFDNDMYVNIDNRKWFQHLVFDSTRFSDYDFGYKIDQEETVNFTAPTGYKIKHLPDNLSIKNDNYSFNVTVTQQGNKVVYHKEIVIFNDILKKKDFKTWNNDLNQLKKIYDDQLILTKS